MKLGKQPAKADLRTLKLARFLTEAAPAGPDTMDWFSGITDFGQMGNDTLGDCTCAALGHALQTQSAAIGSEYRIRDSAVVDAYSRWCGYVPGDESTDRGGVEIDVLNHFRKDGLGGKQLLAYADIDLSDQRNLLKHVTQSIFLFNGLYIGLDLPLTAQKQQTWSVAIDSDNSMPGSWGGHAVWLAGYDARLKDHETFDCITWGERKRMTLDFLRTYCDEAHALLLGDWAVFGSKDFKFGDLQAELAAVTA